MNNVQLTLTVMLPTLAAICGFVTALVVIYVNSGRFNTIELRLSKLDTDVSGLGQRLASVETEVSGLGQRIAKVEAEISGLGQRLGNVEVRLGHLEVSLGGR